MKTRTLLVDGDYLLQRSYHGAKDSYTQKFGYIGALYSFITTIRKLIKEHAINKVVVAWDGENGGIYRHQIDSQYKANRKDKKWNERISLSEAELKAEIEKERSILKQRVRIRQYIEQLFLRQIEENYVEADDFIASYCITNNNKEEIFIFTNDRDFLQMLYLNITILFSNIERPINSTNFFFHFNYHYSNAIIMKVLCGDTSDNIKGIPGMGEDTLMKYFPELKYETFTVREICIRADAINEERVKAKKKPLKVFENLLLNVPRLKMNYQIINLKEPMLNDEAREELAQLEMPLSPENRGSKNLTRMMMEDDFLSVYNGSFVSFVEPFYTVIQNEKSTYDEYMKKNRNNL